MNRKCKVDFCDRQRYCGGLCTKHWTASQKGLPLVDLGPKRMRGGASGTCGLSGCANKSKSKRLCQTHYERKRTGVPDWWRPTTRRSNVADVEIAIRPLESTWLEIQQEIERSGLTRWQVVHRVLDEWAYRQRNSGFAPGVPGERDEEPAWRRSDWDNRSGA